MHLYIHILFLCVYIILCIYTQTKLVQCFPAVIIPVEVCGRIGSFLSQRELVKQPQGGRVRPMLWGIYSLWCGIPSGTKPVCYTPANLRFRVLSLQNVDSLLLRGEREHCHFNVGFKLIPSGIPLESVGRNKKQKQQDIYGIAVFEAFLALS